MCMRVYAVGLQMYVGVCVCVCVHNVHRGEISL